MKKARIIIAALILGTIGFANAQDYYGGPAPRPRQQQESQEPEMTQPTGYFQISFGFAQPVGSFANEFGTGYGGYALPGDNIGISLGIPINHSNFGIALAYSNCSNVFDVGTYTANVAYGDPSLNYYYPNGQDNVYNESFIMAGVYATIPIQRFSFDFKLLGGVSICNLPEIAYGADATSSTATNDFSWDTSPTVTSSFAFGAGGDIRYKLRRISLMFDVDYLAADPIVNSQQQYIDQNGNISYNRVSGGVPISLMNYSLGFAYEIR